MAVTWYPIINKELCAGCGTCVDFCPHGVYEMGDDGYPVVVAPEECVEFCRGCAKICPSGAIAYFGDVEQVPA
ncbi:MAG: ferredoxin family protein [Anaerolineae bacterium]|nr:ferredoxin family protein [Anaerolineae bacterium]